MVSIVVAAYNAEKTLGECLKAVSELDWEKEIEVIVVNDGSTDDTGRIASSFEGVEVLNIENQGAARATNIGIDHASSDIVVSLDSDAVLERDWLKKIIPEFDDSTVGLVAGWPKTANTELLGRLMGYEVEERFDQANKYVDHLYTMNTAYRRDALAKVGKFNEALKVGYDNDMSYRLRDAGYKLVLVKDAVCRHYWRDDLTGYIRQQYNSAYYRLELAQNFGRMSDDISGLKMTAQAPLTLFSLVSAPFYPLILSVPFLIQVPITIRLLFKKREKGVLLMPLLLALRNFVWVFAMVKWSIDRVRRKK